MHPIDQYADIRHALERFDFTSGAVLINVPLVPIDVLDYTVAKRRGYFALPPTTQLYLAAAFREQGVESSIVDLNYAVLKEAQKNNPDLRAAWENALDGALDAYSRPLVCISLMFESTLDQFFEIAQYVRVKSPDACIVAGGVAATADPVGLMRDGACDVVFSHEAGLTLPRFYAFLNGEEVSPVNLTVVDESGKILATEMQSGGPANVDLRDQYSKIPLEDYVRVGSLSTLSRMIGDGVPNATVLTRRGCRARCAFCGVRNFNGKSVRVRERDNIMAEMKFLYEVRSVRHIDFLDDDLLYDEKEAISFFEEMASQLPDLNWVSNNGLIASALSEELLVAMQKSGCRGYKIGLESGNPKILRQVHKPTNLEKFYEFSKLAKKFPSMFVAVNFIVGLPGETVGQLEDTLRAAILGGLDWNNFYLYQHLKNTEFYESYSGLSGSVLETDYARDGQTPKAFMRDINPIRASGFRELEWGKELAAGYEIFNLPMDLVPTRGQLKEIWFAYNMIANFLLMPALTTHEETQLENGVLWMRSLIDAYPTDASMGAVLYFLEQRWDQLSSTELAECQSSAWAKLNASDYWKRRNEQFGFSKLLDGELPEEHEYIRVFLAKPAAHIQPRQEPTFDTV